MTEEKKSKPLFTLTSENIWKIATIVLAIILLFVLLRGGEAPVEEPEVEPEPEPTPEPETPETLGTFYVDSEAEICTEEGKPVVYLFSTTWCPHCTWIIDTFDSTMKEYVDAGDIAAYHWELDTNDNTLTEETEAAVPDEHKAVYQQFNPRGSIPTFVFGCKYYRIGNGHERADDLAAEEQEFRDLIAKMLEEV